MKFLMSIFFLLSVAGANAAIFPKSEIFCSLYNDENFKDFAFQDMAFQANTVDASASSTIPKKVKWDPNDKAYPFRYIRFRSAGYLIQGQRLYQSFSKENAILRLAVYKTTVNLAGEHELLSGMDFKEAKDLPKEFVAKDDKFKATIKCAVKTY